MGDLVNLRTARKRVARKQAELEAEQNRAKHGRTKAERLNERKNMARNRHTLDGAKRERD